MDLLPHLGHSILNIHHRAMTLHIHKPIIFLYTTCIRFNVVNKIDFKIKLQ